MSNTIKDITFTPCNTFLTKNITCCQNNNGRVLNVNVHLNNILRNKNILIAVLLFKNCDLQSIQVKELFTGSNYCSKYTDLYCKDFYFIIPDSNICYADAFKIKIVAQYKETCYSN